MGKSTVNSLQSKIATESAFGGDGDFSSISSFSQCIFGNFRVISAVGSAGDAAMLARGLPPPRLLKVVSYQI